jgi:hypothetical protein
MESRQCEKCGETVEATRAFCPGCGSAMVAEEKRSDVSAFDASAGTIQFGKTVYGKMLSEMGLNISEAPNKASVPSPTAVGKPPAGLQGASDGRAGGSSKTKWIILAAALIFIAMLAVIVAAGLIYFYSIYRPATS